MFKFILKVFTFLIVSIISYVVLLLIWNEVKIERIESNLKYRKAAGHLFTRLRDIDSYSKIDVLVLGSSHAYSSFDPRFFKSKGFEMFNLGSSGQTPIQSELFLNRYLYKLDPKLVILEVFPYSIISDGVESSLDLVSNSKRNDWTTFKLYLESKNIKLLNTFIVAKIFEVMDSETKLIESSTYTSDKYIKGGYVENFEKNKEACRIKEMSVVLNPLQLLSLNRIELLLEKKGIKLIYVTAPVSRKYAESLYPNYVVFNNYFKSKTNFYNFTNLDGLDDSLHFKDCDHLNHYGTLIFNKKLFSKPELFR